MLVIQHLAVELGVAVRLIWRDGYTPRNVFRTFCRGNITAIKGYIIADQETTAWSLQENQFQT